MVQELTKTGHVVQKEEGTRRPEEQEEEEREEQEATMNGSGMGVTATSWLTER